MQIVIDISEGAYNYIKANGARIPYHKLIDVIKDGTPLPKGHGRLGDLEALQKTYCDNNCGSRKCVDAMDRCVFIDAVLNAPTIIEADKE